MSQDTNRDPATSPDETAIDWLVLLHSGNATDSDRAGFLLWRSQSPPHEAAAREAENLWTEIGQTPTARAFTADVPRQRLFSRRLVLGGAVSASIAGLTLLSGAAGPVAGVLADYRTRRGERRRFILPDQSVAWLNTESALSVDFSGQERRLKLHAGEALFEVKKDAARPFIVTAGGGEAQALGTIYAVRLIGSECQVDVEEGVVGVRAALEGEQQKLHTGQRLRYADGRFVAEAEGVNPAGIGAWRRGRLIFNQRPLGDVVADLQRYRYGRIVITNDRLAAMPVSGVFDLDDDIATFEMLSRSLPLEVVHWPLLTLLKPSRT